MSVSVFARPDASIFCVLCLLAASPMGSARADEVDEIVVTATKRETPLRQIGSSVSVLNGAELELRGFRFVGEALRQVPGVSVTRSGGAGQLSTVFLRGEESYRTLMLVDGLEMSDISAPQVTANFANLLLNDVAQIEVVRGPQSLLYGSDAIGGVISVETRRGAQGIEGFAAAEYGAFNTSSLAVGLSGAEGDFDFNISGQYFSTDGFSAKEDDPTLDDKDGYENKSVFAVLGFEPSEDLRLQAVVRYGTAEAEFDGFAFDPDRELFTEETGARISAEWTVLAGRLTQLIAGSRYTSNRADYDGGLPRRGFFGDLQSGFDGEREKIAYLATFQVNEPNAFLLGSDYETEKVRTDAFRDRTGIVGIYGEWQSSIADTVFLTGGLRFDQHEDFGSSLTYRATSAVLLELIPAGETKFHASVGSGFRAPSLNEQGRNATFGLPTIDEEKSRAFDIGVQQGILDGRGAIDVTYFSQRIEDEIRFDNVGFTGYFQSSGSSVSKGVEVALEIEPIDGLKFLASYTYTDSTVNSPDLEDGLPRIRRPKHVGNVDVSYAFWQDRANVGANLRTAAETQDGFREFRTQLDDHAVLDLSAAVELVRGVRLRGRIENVLNEQYQEVNGFATSDRAAYVGIDGRF